MRVETAAMARPFYVPTQETLPIDFYGYHWWLWHAGWFNDRSHAIQASGYGGENIPILPRLNVIVVTTAKVEVDPEQGNRERAGIYETLIRGVILPAVRGSGISMSRVPRRPGSRMSG